MTHEVFMTAVLANNEVDKARAVLRGFTEIRERHRFTRVRHMVPGAKGLPAIKDLQKERGPNAAVWQELHQILTRQAYIVQHRVDVTDEAEAAISTGQPANIPQGKAHRLRFIDLPDVVSHRNPPTNTQRKVLDVSDPRMDRILAQNKFVAKNTSIEESFHWWHNGLEYAIVRTLAVPPGTDLDNSVPDLTGLTNWPPITILFVRIHVESTPDGMQQAHAQLENARKALVGIFDFKIIDRRTHDTRIMEPRQV